MDQNSEELARDLRTIADRIEDGEYGVSQAELSRPSADGDAGHFTLKFHTAEELERMAVVYETATDKWGEE